MAIIPDQLKLAMQFGFSPLPICVPIFDDEAPLRCSCGDPDCDNIGKHPYGNYRMYAVLSEANPVDEEMVDLWRRIHCSTGDPINWAAHLFASKMLVLDFDPRNGGFESFKALEEKYGPMPATVRDSVQGRGNHLWFVAPPLAAMPGVPAQFAVMPGIDLKWGADHKNNSVIIPPSMHKCGHPYTWDEGRAPWECQLAACPQWIIDLANEYVRKKGEKLQRATPTTHAAEPLAQPARVSPSGKLDLAERIRLYMDKVPGAISGHGGHNATFKAACKLVQGFALSPAEAMPFFLEWNLKCVEQWSLAELQHKLESAANTSGPVGYLRDASRPHRGGWEFDPTGIDWDAMFHPHMPAIPEVSPECRAALAAASLKPWMPPRPSEEMDVANTVRKFERQPFIENNLPPCPHRLNILQRFLDSHTFRDIYPVCGDLPYPHCGPMVKNRYCDTVLKHIGKLTSDQKVYMSKCLFENWDKMRPGLNGYYIRNRSFPDLASHSHYGYFVLSAIKPDDRYAFDVEELTPDEACHRCHLLIDALELRSPAGNGHSFKAGIKWPLIPKSEPVHRGWKTIRKCAHSVQTTLEVLEAHKIVPRVSYGKKTRYDEWFAVEWKVPPEANWKDVANDICLGDSISIVARNTVGDWWTQASAENGCGGDADEGGAAGDGRNDTADMTESQVAELWNQVLAGAPNYSDPQYKDPRDWARCTVAMQPVARMAKKMPENGCEGDTESLAEVSQAKNEAKMVSENDANRGCAPPWSGN
jgi:hypothetical protein